MPFFEKDKWVWLEHEREGWVPVQLKSQKKGSIIAKSADGEQFEFKEDLEMQDVNPSSLAPVENMVEMEELSEGAILHNLRLRFEEDLIYTYISSILVSMNPFKQLPIYSPAIMQEYREKLAQRIKMPPHVYALADNAYKSLTLDKQNQAVIISGESGAGKTEATKLVLQYMAEMSGQGSEVEQQLLQANPIIEAFGNAKTARNNNSSRFGKWVEICFNSKYHIEGAKIINYLLEKSRIVTQGEGERNYHIFYQLCFGASDEEKKELHLSHPQSFRITSEGNCFEAPGIDDVREYNEVLAAMEVLQFTQEEQRNLKRVVAGLMHLGNVQFEDSDKTKVINEDALSVCAELLQVDQTTLGQALVSQKKKMGREFILTVMNKEKADDARDAMTKGIYANMFNWLIQRVNQTLFKSMDTVHLVGVLDIFGFEIFNTNRFEQFCINFANEKMQQHFNEHIFTMEQNEYKSDNIDVAHVDFVDNQHTLDMIEKGKQSILGMTDEELRVPRGSDDKLLEKLHNQFKEHKSYKAPKTRDPTFSVIHYAGQVDYTIHGFMVKNKDQMGQDAQEVVRNSENKFISELMPPAGEKPKTVGKQFKTQLSELMATLKATNPHFIRCIKSTNLKVSDTFEAPMILRQLRYLGLKEVVNIRQLGYPIRRLHLDFWQRYAMLDNKVRQQHADASDPKQACVDLCQALELDPIQYRIGDTKVFIRNAIQTKLETLRETQLNELVVKLQSMARARVWRSRYQRLKGAEQALRQAMEGEDDKILDSCIVEYEALQLNTNKTLLKQAIQRRNFLSSQRKAKKALAKVVDSTDVALLKAAIAGAEKAQLDPTWPDLLTAKSKIVALEAYHTEADNGLKNRDLALCKSALAKCIELGFQDSTKHERLEALVAQLEEEQAVKNRLQDAMKNRDLDALRHALQVAMKAESGAMVGNALERLKAAGLADDPIVKEALAMESKLEKEVSVYKLANELKAAIESRDASMLQAVVKIATDKNFTTHALYGEATSLLETLNKQKALLQALTDALSDKKIESLQAAINAVDPNDEDTRGSAEYQEAVAVLNQLLKATSDLKAATENSDGKVDSAAIAAAAALGLDTSAVAGPNQDLVNTLQTAIEAKDLGLLKAAVAAAKADMFPVDNEHYKTAKELLQDLQDQEELQEEELHAAENAEAQEDAKGTDEQTTSAAASSAATGKILDVDTYDNDQYKFSRFSKLRAPNDYVSNVIFKKDHVKSKRLRFIKSVIPTSVTETHDSHRVNQAIQMFKSVQGFMGNRHYSFPESLVPELTTMVLEDDFLRTELFVQVVKQLTRNPFPESVKKGWMLLALLLECFPPTEDFLPYLVYFLHSIRKDDEIEESSRQYAAYCMHTLTKTYGTWERPTVIEAPVTVEHVSAFKERTMTPGSIDVWFEDGSQISVMVQPWDTNDVLIPRICEQIGLTATFGCAIYEIKGERVTILRDNECPLDFQDKWQQATKKQEIVQESKSFWSIFRRKEEKKEEPVNLSWEDESGVRRFVFKRRVYPQPVGESKDPVMNKMMYHEFCRAMTAGQHFIKVTSALTLALTSKHIAESKQLTLIGSPPTDEQLTKAAEDHDPFLNVCYHACPPNLLRGRNKITAKKWEKSLAKAIASAGELTANTPEHYLAMVKKLVTFGANFYTVRQSYDNSYPSELVLAVNSYGVCLQDVKTRAELDHFPLMSVLGWSSSPVMVLLKVKLKKKTKAGKSSATLRFKTPNSRTGKEICDLLLAYAHELMRAIQAQRQSEGKK